MEEASYLIPDEVDHSSMETLKIVRKEIFNFMRSKRLGTLLPSSLGVISFLLRFSSASRVGM